MLDDLGLLPAVEWLTDDLEKQFGIKAELRLIGTERRLIPEAELLFFRVIQEAISNVRRHAKASQVEITIEYDNGKTRAIVRDNGEGFELPKTLAELSRTGKLGLVGMEERARLLGGSLRLESEPGKGTVVVIEAPV
jgi:signal transduction histidine kinase